MPPGANRLRALYRLSRIGPGDFLGDCIETLTGTVFGGQQLAQSIIAADSTLARSRPLHSIHAHFISPGTPRDPIELRVSSLQQGATSSRRLVSIHQGRLQLSQVVVSFQVRSAGPVRRLATPTVRPTPTNDKRSPHILPSARHIAWEAGIQLVSAEPMRAPSTPLAPVRYTWIRLDGPLPPDPLWHAATTAFASDLLLVPNILEVDDDPKEFQLATLDHAMWFFGDSNMDDGTLIGATSSLAGYGRSLTQAHAFTQGSASAAIAQEALVRRTAP